MSARERIHDLVRNLIDEGDRVLGTEWKQSGNWVGGAPRFVDLAQFKKWRASCALLVELMGDLADPWREVLARDSPNNIETAIGMQGTLKAIDEALDNDLLVRFEDLVFAEAFSDLVEQAEYLFGQGYVLASGVILRAVLEERLLQMCDRGGCLPTKKRPTIADYNTELYKAKVYDKITMKHVDSMAAIGNDAAHNNPDLQKDDVGRFRHDLISFLQKFAA
ncbi:hypothetical protein FHS27_004433 [Rhodopirellula rubra]|uniref:DUF4145 domain-containing protein n=1 Tax=Aporhodopirellula rubra TaxID=980271 RepID=A0A7W5E1R8_9BACT|nr:DUF4145 domain-containing protein [Aporhodopirellula rubra]MBB3208601.1 hypothetical protein [Aporhodopirellula rubra]